MTLNRTLSIALGAAVLTVGIAVLFSTTPDPAPLNEAGDEVVAAAGAAEPSPAPPAPAPAVRVDERPTPMVHPLLPVDPYAGRDVHTLYGKVVDTASNEPVDYFVAWVAPVADGDIVTLARDNRYAKPFRNRLGAFTFRGLDPGEYNLLIRVAGYEDAVVKALEVPTDGDLMVPLSRGAWVQVECVDSDEDGLGGIEVRLIPVRFDDPRAETPRVRLRRTDDYGKALFSDLPSGVYKVELLNKALNPYPGQEFYLGAGSNHPIRIVVQTANTLTVRVRDTEGDPVGHAHVRLFSTGEEPMIFRLETDRSGDAEQEFVPQGEYTVKVWKPGFFRLSSKLNIATVTGEHVETLELRVDPTNGEAERNPTPEQLEKLKAGMDPADVFGGG